MKVTDQYVHLVEMVANARILAAHSDNKDVSHHAEKVKRLGSDMARDLGVTDRHFNDDTIKRYKQLSEGVR